MLDEAQRLRRASWVSINSTMSAMPNPQVWLLGTPPTPDDMDAGMGDVFTSIRSAAVDGVSTAAAWAEWGSSPKDADYDPASEYTRWKANPAWNTRINHEIVQGEFESYTEEEFAQDRLGVWLDEVGGGGSRAISADLWTALEGSPPEGGYPTYGVAFSQDGMRMSLGGGFRSLDSDTVHVELIDDTFVGAVEGGLAPLADWFLEKGPGESARWRRCAAIVLAGGSGAGVLRQYLIERGVSKRKIIVASTVQYLQACEMTRKAAEDHSLTHKASGQQALDDSVAFCDRDKRGGWMATVPGCDETPVEAISVALWGARTARPPRAAGERGGVIL
jgi:hypothetical protein